MADRDAAFLASIEADGNALLAAVAMATQAPVPACPGWDNATLAAHVGRIWHYVSRQVRSTERLDSSGAPPEGVAAVDWAREGLLTLRHALRETGPTAQSWNWAQRQAVDASFWFRRMAQETAVHRWDAQSALGDPEPIPAWLAADGIEEWASMWLPRYRAEELSAGRHSVTGTAHLHAGDPTEDEPSEWFIVLGPDGGSSFTHEHQKGDAVLRGNAHDILLRLWGRPCGVEEFGSAAVLEALRAE